MYYNNHSIIIFLLESLSGQYYLMVFHWTLSDSKCPQVTRTFPSILSNRNNAVVWNVSTLVLISKTSNVFIYPLVTVPRAQIKIFITFILMFNGLFFHSLARLGYLFFCLLSVIFIRWSAGTQKSILLLLSNSFRVFQFSVS